MHNKKNVRRIIKLSKSHTYLQLSWFCQETDSAKMRFDFDFPVLWVDFPVQCLSPSIASLRVSLISLQRGVETQVRSHVSQIESTCHHQPLPFSVPGKRQSKVHFVCFMTKRNQHIYLLNPTDTIWVKTHFFLSLRVIIQSNLTEGLRGVQASQSGINEWWHSELKEKKRLLEGSSMCSENWIKSVL